MGLITGLVSTVVHAAAGRNPYSHNHNNQSPVTTVDSAAGAGGPHDGYHTGPDGQPCGICKVALPFGKGREARRDRRAALDERRAVIYAMRAQQRGGGRWGRLGYDASPGFLAAGPYHHQQQQQQQQRYYNNMSRGGPSGVQEEGVEEWQHERRRASTGDNVPPPAYSAAGPSSSSTGIEASRSVEVLGNGDEKHGQEKA
ncbi:hypothetical protein CORC01_12666 [Colletotrichum orchidophilum]|uniref:Uncharacterized protein n=1 Tax=Colletotrichum orchidophilum TaxID=1209926 RepID=A0A1G4AS90_9PEZI|nr:uncharacterized protein CORC01_12666 [Colletotrichum orchidophilum]OHE92027.1 hypothetical protein CORC01_12666 [Colletotrichum orchidophilum]